MRIKTFTAASIAQAMAQVRAELGDDAVIVSTDSPGKGRGARVVVALDTPSEDDAALAQWADAPEARGDAGADPGGADDTVTQALADHGIAGVFGERLARAFAACPAEQPEQRLAAALDACLAFQPLTERRSHKPLMLVGPPGVGKTLTAAKLIVDAHRQGRTVIAISSDGRRAGGVEQLEAFTRLLGLQLVAASAPPTLARITAAAAGAVIIVDTPGTSPFDDAGMRELRDLVLAAAAEPVLVLATGADRIDAAEQAHAFAGIGCRRIVATRLDVSRRLGALLHAADAAGLALAGTTASPHAADAVCTADALPLARLLLSVSPSLNPGFGRPPGPAPRKALP